MNIRELTVEDIMSTALITARADENIDHADFDMKLANIRHVLVVDDRDQLVGLVSSRDVLLALGESGKKPVLLRSVMTTEAQTVTGDTSAADAVEILMNEKIGCLPVLGQEGQLIGIVTETDFLRIAHHALAGGGGEREVA